MTPFLLLWGLISYNSVLCLVVVVEFIVNSFNYRSLSSSNTICIHNAHVHTHSSVYAYETVYCLHILPLTETQLFFHVVSLLWNSALQLPSTLDSRTPGSSPPFRETTIVLPENSFLLLCCPGGKPQDSSHWCTFFWGSQSWSLYCPVS